MRFSTSQLSNASSYWLIESVAAILEVILFLVIFYLGCARKIYPSDIIFGALIGVWMALIFNIKAIKEFISRPVYLWIEKYPGLFYSCLFLLSYEVVDLFTDIRKIGSVLREVLKYIIMN